MLEGEATVTIDEAERVVAAGETVFIAGNARHACRNDGTTELRFAYVLAADSFADVDYEFST